MENSINDDSRRKNSNEDISETVAKLPDTAPCPYTSLSLSPYGRLIVIASKDTVRFVSVKPSGLKEVKTIRISQVSLYVFSIDDIF